MSIFDEIRKFTGGLNQFGQSVLGGAQQFGKGFVQGTNQYNPVPSPQQVSNGVRQASQVAQQLGRGFVQGVNKTNPVPSVPQVQRTFQQVAPKIAPYIPFTPQWSARPANQLANQVPPALHQFGQGFAQGANRVQNQAANTQIPTPWGQIQPFKPIDKFLTTQALQQMQEDKQYVLNNKIVANPRSTPQQKKQALAATVPFYTNFVAGIASPLEEVGGPISKGISKSLEPLAGQTGGKNPVSALTPEIEGYLKELQQGQKEAANTAKVGLVQKAQGFLSDVKRKLVDSTAPIEDILSSAQKEGKYQVLPTKNISPQIDRVLRSNELAGQFLKDHGMVDVIRGVPDINALDQYLIAKHAPEVEAAGFRTGRDLTKDSQLVKELAPTYEPFAQKVTQYGQKLLDYATQTGLVSKETADALKQKYPNYVPLNRIFNELEKSGVPEGVSRAVASLSKQSVVQGLKGSERAIQNPIESLLTKTTDAFGQGERNQAAQMLSSYKDLPGNPFQLRELKPGESATHTVSFLDNGVKKVFETTPEIAQAAKFLDKRQLGLIGQLFSLPVRIARVGITGINFPFVASNIAKDQVSAAINSDKALQTSIANPGVFLKSLWTAIGHGAEYDNWVRNAGGGTSFDISRSAPATSVEQIRAGRNVGSKIAYTVTHPDQLLRAIENIVSRGEETTRLQQFLGTRDSLLKQGRTPQDANILAAKASRENTVNFARSGDWGKALNSVFLYMNAGIQGSRTLVRNLQTRPLQTASKIGLTVFTPLAAVTAWNMSDPKRLEAYNDIRDFEKDNNLVIIPPNPTKDANGKWNVIKVPFSQEIANLTIPVRKGIEALHGADGPGFGDFVSSILGSTTSLNTQSPNALVGQFIPQAVKPPMEALLNKNLFTGTDIVPQYINGKLSKTLPPSEQVQDNTSGTARKIGGLLNTSPIKVEQFIKSAAGGVGSQLLNASDQALAATGVIPSSQVGGQSIAQGLASRFSQASGGQDLSNLYSKIDEANNKKTSLDLNQSVTSNGKVYYPTLVAHKDGTTSYALDFTDDLKNSKEVIRKSQIHSLYTTYHTEITQKTQELSSKVIDKLNQSPTYKSLPDDKKLEFQKKITSKLESATKKVVIDNNADKVSRQLIKDYSSATDRAQKVQILKDYKSQGLLTPNVLKQFTEAIKNQQASGKQPLLQAPKTWPVIRTHITSQVDPTVSTQISSGAPKEYQGVISQASSTHGVPANILTNLIRTESNFNPRAGSRVGARGLAQFMPATAKALGVNVDDPQSSIDGAARYLKQLYDQFGSWPLALAAYNSGPGNVRKYGGIPPFKETQNYVKKILGGPNG